MDYVIESGTLCTHSIVQPEAHILKRTLRHNHHDIIALITVVTPQAYPNAVNATPCILKCDTAQPTQAAKCKPPLSLNHSVYGTTASSS